MKSLSLLVSLGAAALLSGCATTGTKTAETFRGAKPIEWSERMARSEMARQGDQMFRDKNPQAKWSYTTPLVGLCLMRLSDHTGQPDFGAYGVRTATSFIQPGGLIAGYKQEDFNIDLVAPGKVLVRAWTNKSMRSPELFTAIETLRDQMRLHPRTQEGGFWHKKRYPHQMWLDGLFMASPFLAHYAVVFNEPALFDDVANQIVLMDKHAFDPATGLWFHAYDEARAQPWANPVTGDSPGFWSRAIGWYVMAVVDTLEYMPKDHPRRPEIEAILRRLADGIVRWQDAESGAWWQVTDQGNRKGNYLEGTATSMFVYAIARGINQGVLSKEKYLQPLLKGYTGLINRLVRVDADGSVHLIQCCEVAGLGGMGKGGLPRDGSFEYYISEPVIDNDHKGVGPFISAGIELDLLLK